jgi:hypothetical protein
MSTVETHETPVARKRRTSAISASKARVRSRSSTNSRKGAGGQTEGDTQIIAAAGNNPRKGRTAAMKNPASTLSAPQSKNPRKGASGQCCPDVQHPCATRKQSSRKAGGAVHIEHDAHIELDSANPTTGCQSAPGSHAIFAAGYSSHQMPDEQRDAIASINDAWRKRQGIVRAMTKLSLQAQASLRSGRDREEAAKIYAALAKDPTHQEYPVIAPYLEAMVPLAKYRSEHEKTITKLVKKLPIYQWAQGVSGLGDVSLAGLVGECSGYNMETDELWSIGQMKSVSALWKRMGVGVIGGIRQQRVKGDAAIEHGYVAERRSVLWNIGECIVKAQWRKENTVHAYGKLYGEIKVRLQERNGAGEFAETATEIAARMRKAGSKPSAENAEGRLTAMHINNRAKRHVTKRLLRDLFVEWRRLDAEARGEFAAPVAEAA